MQNKGAERIRETYRTVRELRQEIKHTESLSARSTQSERVIGQYSHFTE